VLCRAQVNLLRQVAEAHSMPGVEALTIDKCQVCSTGRQQLLDLSVWLAGGVGAHRGGGHRLPYSSPTNRGSGTGFVWPLF
jgi:hypothetical protein